MVSVPQLSKKLALEPVVRGYVSRVNNLKEQFQTAAVRAIASAAGCVVMDYSFDPGHDITLMHNDGSKEALLMLQLKATEGGWNADHTVISTQMTKERFDEYASLTVSYPRIVVIMDIPKDLPNWIRIGKDATVLRHRCYWTSLAGLPEATAKKPTVHAHVGDVFDDVVLARIMSRIRREGKVQ